MFLLCLYVLPGDDPDYLITGTHAYPSGPGKINTIIWTKLRAFSRVIIVVIPVIFFQQEWLWLLTQNCTGIQAREESTPWRWLCRPHKQGEPFFSSIMFNMAEITQLRYIFRILTQLINKKFEFCSTFRQDVSRTAASVGDIHHHAGGAGRSHPPSSALVGHFICVFYLRPL